jgi:hypothetical protein
MRELFSFSHDCFVLLGIAGLLTISCLAFWALLNREAALNLTDNYKTIYPLIDVSLTGTIFASRLSHFTSLRSRAVLGWGRNDYVLATPLSLFILPVSNAAIIV